MNTYIYVCIDSVCTDACAHTLGLSHARYLRIVFCVSSNIFDDIAGWQYLGTKYRNVHILLNLGVYLILYPLGTNF